MYVSMYVKIYGEKKKRKNLVDPIRGLKKELSPYIFLVHYSNASQSLEHGYGASKSVRAIASLKNHRKEFLFSPS